MSEECTPCGSTSRQWRNVELLLCSVSALQRKNTGVLSEETSPMLLFPYMPWRKNKWCMNALRSSRLWQLLTEASAHWRIAIAERNPANPSTILIIHTNNTETNKSCRCSKSLQNYFSICEFAGKYECFFKLFSCFEINLYIFCSCWSCLIVVGWF